MTDPDPRNGDPKAAGAELAVRMVEELVLLRQALEIQTKLLADLHDVVDESNAYWETLSRTVVLMQETGQKPNWGTFLDAWAQAEAEIFGDDDDEDEGGDEDPAPHDPTDSPRRRVRVS